MAKRLLGTSLIVVCWFSLSGCASTESDSDDHYAERMRSPSAEQAARVLNCDDDEVAICIQTNCELEEFQCANRDDVRLMFKAGEFRHD